MLKYAVVVAALIMGAAIATASTSAAATVEVGIDADPTGNTANTLGAIENCRTVQQGDTFTVDAFVKGVPPAEGFSLGISGFGFNFEYDPVVLRVTAIDANFILGAAGPRNPFEIADDLPDTDGNFRVDEADLSQSFESGDGVLLRLTLEAVGPGLSPLALTDARTGGIPEVFGAAGEPQYDISSIDNAAVSVGGTCTAPTPVIPVTPVPEPTIGAVLTASPANDGATGTPAPGETTSGSPSGAPGPTVPPNGEAASDGGGLGTTAIVALVVAAVAGAGALGMIGWYFWNRSR